VNHVDVYLIGLGAALLFVGTAFVRGLLLKRASKEWPAVEGKVLSGHSKGVSTGRGAVVWYAEMTYSFTTVEGDYYGGRFDHHVASEAAADEYVERIKDARLSVRYKPGNPETSIATVV
jgi:hypothetical protein